MFACIQRQCMQDEIDALRQRVKELEADAQRYRWLKANCGFGIRKNGVHELTIAFHRVRPDCIHQLDCAIDTAMKTNHEETDKHTSPPNPTSL